MPTFLINICPLLIPPGKKNYIGKKKEIVVKVKLYLCELCWNGNKWVFTYGWKSTALALLQNKAEMVEEKVIWLNDVQLEQTSKLMRSI